MHKTRGLLYLTFRELWAKKIIVGLFIVSTLVWVALMFALNVDQVEGGISMLRLFGSDAAIQGGSVPPANPSVDPEMSPNGQGGGGLTSFRQFTFIMQTAVAGSAYWIGTLLALFAAAPLFARLLESGHIDLLLSKPMSRARLLAGHVLGVLLLMTVLATYLVGAVWLVLSIKVGVWNAKFLLSILVMVGMFAILYAVIAFMTIWTESTALALIVTYGIIFISIVLRFRDQITEQLSPLGDAFFNLLYYLVPNFTEVGGLTTQLLHGEAVARWTALGSTIAVGALLYLAAGVWFTRRDF